MGFALVALPILLALYVAKDAVVTWRRVSYGSMRHKLTFASSASSVALTALCIAIAGIGAHIFGSGAGVVVFLWFEGTILIGAKADMSLGRGNQRT